MEPPFEPDRRSPSPKSLPEQRLGVSGAFVVALGSFLAVPGVMLDFFTHGGGDLLPILAGPLIEETLKPAGLLIVIARRPGLRLSGAQGFLAGAFAGLVFASLENVLYLHVYVPEHTSAFALWRWTVCAGLHVSCSALVGYGLAHATRDRRNLDDSYRRIAQASPHLLEAPRERSVAFRGRHMVCLVIAVLVHGAYNLTVLVLESTTDLFEHFVR